MFALGGVPRFSHKGVPDRFKLAPLKIIKILLQVQYAKIYIPVNDRYNGIRDRFKRVIKEQVYVAMLRKLH